MSESASIVVDLVHESPVVRHGLAAMIRTSSQLVVGREAASAAEFLSGLSDRDSVVILASPPAGAEVLRRQRTEPAPALILVAAAFAAMSARSGLADGALGLLELSAEVDELICAVRSVARGQRYVMPKVASQLAQACDTEELTPRENTLLLHLCEGHSNKEIAQRMGITLGTAKAYVKAILSKLSAKSRTEAVVIATRTGVLQKAVSASERAGG